MGEGIRQRRANPGRQRKALGGGRPAEQKETSMSRAFTRIRRAGTMAGACTALFLGTACASAGDPSAGRPAAPAANRGYPTGLVGQRLAGVQGDVTIPAAPPAVEHPYALTGDETAGYERTNREFTGPTGRWVEVGQGRVWVPPAP